MPSITRVHTSDLGEISHVAPHGSYVYFLFQRRLQPIPYLKIDLRTDKVTGAFMPPYPITTWFWSKHGSKIVFVGQAYAEGWETPDPCNPSSIAVSIVFTNGIPSFHIIPHTDNVSELIGACYHNGWFKAGERSGYIPHADPDYYRKCADHKDGGGIWISSDGKNWGWSGFRDPYLNLGLVQYGREAHLAVLNGKFYAFMHGGTVPERVPTSVYEVHANYSTTHIADTPSPNIGLVPYPINYANEANQFSWKGCIILLSSYPALGVFDGSTLRFWNIKLNGIAVDNAGATPVGIYNGKLLMTVTINGEYTICVADELFGEVRQIADNWLTGSMVKGVLVNKKLVLGAGGANGCALDVFNIEGIPPPPPPKRIVTLMAGEGGIVTPPIGEYEVEEGEIFTATATPLPEYNFLYWKLGDATRTDNPIKAVITKDILLTAHFTTETPPPPPPPPSVSLAPLFVFGILFFAKKKPK